MLARAVLEIERDVVSGLSEQEYNPTERVGVTHLTEYVWIAPGHICFDYVCSADLIQDPLKHALVVEFAHLAVVCRILRRRLRL